MSAVLCPVCKKDFINLRKHYGQKPQCAIDAAVLNRQIVFVNRNESGIEAHSKTRPETTHDVDGATPKPVDGRRKSARLSLAAEEVLICVTETHRYSSRSGEQHHDVEDIFLEPELNFAPTQQTGGADEEPVGDGKEDGLCDDVPTSTAQRLPPHVRRRSASFISKWLSSEFQGRLNRFLRAKDRDEEEIVQWTDFLLGGSSDEEDASDASTGNWGDEDSSFFSVSTTTTSVEFLAARGQENSHNHSDDEERSHHDETDHAMYFACLPVGSEEEEDEQTVSRNSSANDPHDIKFLGKQATIPVSEILERMPFLTESEEACLELYQVLDKAGAPLHLFDDVAAVISKHSSKGFCPIKYEIPSRKTLFRRLEKKFQSPKPEVVPVVLENGTENNPLEYHIGFHDKVNVVRWNAKELVVDMLDDMEIFGNIDNLAVNPGDPFGRYVPMSPFDGEIHAHKWYQDTYTQDIEDPTTELLLGIVIGNDKTGTDGFQRFGGEPFLMSLSIIKGTMRRLGKCWRVLGYLPDLEQGSSAKKKKNNGRKAGKGRSQRNYHKCASIILESLKELEKGFLAHVRIGDDVRLMRIKCRIAFVVGDGKNGDVLCNRFQGKRCQRICRACAVDHHNLDNCTYQCEFMNAPDLNDLYQMAVDGNIAQSQRNEYSKQLHAVSTHLCENAFSGHNFGSNRHGITLGSPSDMMHLYELGIIKYLLCVFVASMTTTVREAVDALIERLFQGHRSCEKKHHLRMNFVRGATQLTLLASHEWMGLASSMLVMLLTEEGQQICSSCFQEEDVLHEELHEEDIPRVIIDNQIPTFDVASISSSFSVAAAVEGTSHQRLEEDGGEEEASLDDIYSVDQPDNLMQEEILQQEDILSGKCNQAEKLNCSLNQFVKLLEDLLIYHAWYKREEAPIPVNASDDEAQQLNIRVRKLVHELIHCCPRRSGHGWKLQKLHEMFHFTVAAWYFGRPDNWDASYLERNLIVYVKSIAKICQKRIQPEYLRQMGKRIYERSIIHKAVYAAEAQYIKISKDGTEPPMGFVGNPKFNITRRRDSVGRRACTFDWLGANKGILLHPVVSEWFRTSPTIAMNASIDGYTEYAFHDPNGERVLVRAHPHYRGGNGGYTAGEAVPWHDWVMILFDIGGLDDELSSYPAKLLLFYRDTSRPVLDDQDRAVVFCANYQRCSADERLSNRTLTRLCEQWECWTEDRPSSAGNFAPRLMDVPVQSITRPLFVIEEDSVLREGYKQPPKFWVVESRKKSGSEKGWESLRWW